MMLDRISALHSNGFGLTVEQHEGPGEGWLAADALDARSRQVAGQRLRHRGLRPPAARRRVAARDCAWQGASLAVAAALDGWVPDLTPGNVLLWFRDGGVWGIALREVRVAGAGPRAAHDALEALLTPVVAAIAARRLRPSARSGAPPATASARRSCGPAPPTATRRASATARRAILAPPSRDARPAADRAAEDGTPATCGRAAASTACPRAQVCAAARCRQSPRLRAAA